MDKTFDDLKRLEKESQHLYDNAHDDMSDYFKDVLELIFTHERLMQYHEQLQKKFDEAIKHLKFTFHAAEHVYQPDKPLHKGIDPTFYHTLTYEGDLKRIKQTNAAKEFLRSLDKEK